MVTTAETETRPKPYHTTVVFDENTLPEALQKTHRTKEGAWAVLRILEGRLNYEILEPHSFQTLTPEHPGVVYPDQPHRVEPLGPMRMQIEFYDCLPAEAGVE